MTKTLTVCISARTKSERCSNKLLRSFADTTLIDIALEKMKIIQKKYKVLFAAHEKILLDKAIKLSIPVYKRSKKSSLSKDNLKDIHEAIKFINSDYIAILNPCCPFLSIKTITTALDHFMNSSCVSLSCVEKSREWLFFQDNSLVMPITTISTETCNFFWRVTHTLDIYPRKRFYYDEILWKGKKQDPELFEISFPDTLDIDYEEQFYEYEYLFRKNKNISISRN